MKTQSQKFTMLVLVMLLIVTGCNAPAPTPVLATPVPTQPPPTPTAPNTATSPATAAAVMGAAERLNAGDLEGYRVYWAEDARFYVFGLPTGNEVSVGWEQMQPGFQENIDSHFKEQVEILTVNGDTVTARTTTWHDFTRQIGVAPLVASETYVIKNGKIASLTWIITSESLAKLKPALATALPPAPPSTPADAPLASVSALTITIAGGQCIYEGPMALSKGFVNVTLDVKDQDKSLYALTFFNLDPGKTLADLMPETSRAPTPPAWAGLFAETSSGLPGRSTTFDMLVTKGPVYAICWSQPPDLPIGSLGPFEVSQ